MDKKRANATETAAMVPVWITVKKVQPYRKVAAGHADVLHLEAEMRHGRQRKSGFDALRHRAGRTMGWHESDDAVARAQILIDLPLRGVELKFAEERVAGDIDFRSWRESAGGCGKAIDRGSGCRHLLQKAPSVHISREPEGLPHKRSR